MMIDQEFNERIEKLVSYTSYLVGMRGPLGDEELGKWDELLEERMGHKESADRLFSIPENELTAKNNAAIASLRKEGYPVLLCDLAKCYIAKDCHDKAREILTEAVSLGSKAAEALLGFSYAHGSKNDSDGQMAFSILRKCDLLSESMRQGVKNDRFLVLAQYYRGQLYRIFGEDLEASHSCLSSLLNTAWIPDDFVPTVQEELGHFKRGMFGKLKYVK